MNCGSKIRKVFGQSMFLMFDHRFSRKTAMNIQNVKVSIPEGVDKPTNQVVDHVSYSVSHLCEFVRKDRGSLKFGFIIS